MPCWRNLSFHLRLRSVFLILGGFNDKLRDLCAQGVRVALSDLLIGVTALELGYRVATANVRHFQMVPGLGIVPF